MIVLVALTLYCTIEVAQAKTWEVRRMPKWLWAVAVIGVPGFGPLAWLFFGRPVGPRRGVGGGGGNRPLPRPPGGNPAFLGGLWPAGSPAAEAGGFRPAGRRSAR